MHPHLCSNDHFQRGEGNLHLLHKVTHGYLNGRNELCGPYFTADETGAQRG